MAGKRGDHHAALYHGESPPDGARHHGIDCQKLGYAYGSKTPNIPDQGAYVALEQVLRARYPALRPRYQALLEWLCQRRL